MVLYLGSDRVKFNLDGAVYCVNLGAEQPQINGILLASSDGYILQDSNGTYLVVEE